MDHDSLERSASDRKKGRNKLPEKGQAYVPEPRGGGFWFWIQGLG